MVSAIQNPLGERGQYQFPPGFQRNLLWVAFRRLRPANPIILFQHLAEAYGDIAHYKIGWNHILFLNHPDYIREILVVQNGRRGGVSVCRYFRSPEISSSRCTPDRCMACKIAHPIKPAA